MRPIGIDLFAGVGGMSLGFEQAGFDVLAAVEIDPIHCASHEFNFPNCTMIPNSVAAISGAEIRKLADIGTMDIDVVFGGAPCQGFSMIGKRAFDDPRNQLVFHFVRLISELNPKFFVFENVKGLTQGKHRQFLDEIITEMDKIGYSLSLPYKVLNAADHGVPQERHRLFLVGAREDQSLPSYPEKADHITTVWDAIGDLPNLDDFPQLWEKDAVTVTWKSKSEYARRMRGYLQDDSDFSHPRMTDPNILTSSTRTAHSELSQSRFLSTLNGDTEPISRFKKLAKDGYCNTLRAGTDSARGAFTSPRPIHPVFPRVISVREAARLHSYPDWFRFHSTKWHGFRQIGNSVPPLLARAVASAVIQAMGIKPSKPTEVLGLGRESLLSMDMTAASRYYKISSKSIAQRSRPKPQTANSAQLSLI